MIWETLANIPASQLMTFIAGGLILNFAPGQDVFFASACGIQGGSRAGALAGFGVGLGVLMHLTIAVVGLGAIVAANPGMLKAIKYAGAAYLFWLAYKSWTAGPVDPSARGSVRTWNIIRRGFLSNALNPKPVLFLLSFLPQFTNSAWGPIWQQVLGLGLIFLFTGTLVTMGYGIVGGIVGQVIGPKFSLLNKIAAVMYTGLAARLVLK